MGHRRDGSQPGRRDASHPEDPTGEADAGSRRSSRSAPPCPTKSPQESPKLCSSIGHRDGPCPVCLQTATFPVSTNCGHLFCAPCLIGYWRYGSWLSAVSCPVCRQEVNALRHLFSESLSDRRSKEVVVDISDYNRRYSGAPRKVMDYLWDAPLFLQLLARGLTAAGGLLGLFFFRVALCCLGAIVSISSHPLDTVSSSSSSSSSSVTLGTSQSLCVLLGVLDDLVVVVLLLICIINNRQQRELERRGSVSALTTHGVL